MKFNSTSGPVFASQLVEIYFKFQKSPLAISKRPLETIWQCFPVGIRISLSQSAFFFGCADFCNCAKGSKWHLWLSHSRCVQSRCVNCIHQCGNHASQYPTSNCSVAGSCTITREATEEYRSAPGCYLLRRVCETNWTTCMDIYWGRLHDACILTMSRNRFSQRPNWMLFPCPHGPNIFGSSWMSLKTRCPRLTPDRCHRMPLVGTQVPHLEPSALVHTIFAVQFQPLPLW